MKKVLVLGGGVYQVPLIRRAVEKGYRITVASLCEDDPGMGLSHESITVNITDKETICAFVRENDIDAVVSTGTEFSIPTIGFVHEQLGLPGISQETATITTNKILAQTRFAEHGVPLAHFRRVETLSGAVSAAEEIGFPVFVKAPDSSGSRGISMVQTPEEMVPAFNEAMSISRNGEALVEEMLTGLEFGAQVIVVNGEVRQCLCHNDTVSPPPVTVPIGHSLPFTGSEDIERAAFDVCARAVKALNIQNAVCNADLIAAPGGVRVFEIGARIGATGLAEIVELHHGINLYDTALSFALGETPEIRVRTGSAAAYLIVQAPGTGKLVRCVVPDSVSGMTGVVEAAFDSQPGTRVKTFRVGPDRIGHVLVTAGTVRSAEELAVKAAGMLDIEVEAE